MNFNKSTIKNMQTTNKEGGLAYITDKKTELFLRCATYLYGEGKFYASGSSLNTELFKCITEVLQEDPEFILKLAYYCRHALNLRSLPMVLLAEYANSDKVGKVSGARKYISGTIQRADDITELIAYQFARNKISPRRNKIPMVLKKGVADSFNKFDAYQLSKYNRKDTEVSLKDVILLTHPKANSVEQSDIFKKIIDDTLESPETWEVVLSDWRKNFNSKKDAWEKIVNKMGIMAITRNLRNMLVEGVDPSIYENKFRDPYVIENSRMYPFRFYSAYREIERSSAYAKNPQDIPVVMNALECAIDNSVTNLPKIGGVTCVMVDLSGSMGSMLSKNSQVSYRDISSLMGSIVHAISKKSVNIAFASDAKFVSLSDRDGVISNALKINKCNVGGATYAYKAMKLLLEQNICVDRVIMLSDMQCYNEDIGSAETVQQYLTKYRNTVNSDVYMYSVDLSGYGTVTFPPGNLRNILLSGWSDKILRFIDMYEKDRKRQIDEIEAISIS